MQQSLKAICCCRGGIAAAAAAEANMIYMYNYIDGAC